VISLRNLSNPDLVGHRVCALLEHPERPTQATFSMQFGPSESRWPYTCLPYSRFCEEQPV